MPRGSLPRPDALSSSSSVGRRNPRRGVIASVGLLAARSLRALQSVVRATPVRRNSRQVHVASRQLLMTDAEVSLRLNSASWTTNQSCFRPGAEEAAKSQCNASESSTALHLRLVPRRLRPSTSSRCFRLGFGLAVQQAAAAPPPSAAPPQNSIGFST